MVSVAITLCVMNAVEPFDPEPPRLGTGIGYAWALGVCALTTLLTHLGAAIFDLAALIMLYLVGVVWVAARHGQGPAVLASLLSVLAFDFFFVPPRLLLSVNDTSYLLTFAVMLMVALTISGLAANLRRQARIAVYRERRTQALNELTKELAGALTREQIQATVPKHLEGFLQARAWVLLPDGREQLRLPAPATEYPATLDLSLAQWVYDHQQPAGLGTQHQGAAPMHYLPLKAPVRTRGVLAILPSQHRWLFLPEQARLLESLAGQAALALERVHYAEVAGDALVRMESERLRNSLLAALSHDLRTPLTILAGLAESLSLAGPPLPAPQAEIAQAIHAESLRTGLLVSNLLDMARLQEGNIHLNKEWQPLEEVVGAALQNMAWPLAGHRVEVDLPVNLPLLEFDTLLMERTLCNLLENAAKYSPPGGRILITARPDGDWVQISVSDQGPGLPPGRPDALFEKFNRGQNEPPVAGVGLGLSIVRTIVEAHQGSVRAEAGPDGGARLVIRLPLGEPPEVPEESRWMNS